MINEWIDRWMNGLMDRWINVWMVGWMGKLMNEKHLMFYYVVDPFEIHSF